MLATLLMVAIERGSHRIWQAIAEDRIEIKCHCTWLGMLLNLKYFQKKKMDDMEV